MYLQNIRLPEYHISGYQDIKSKKTQRDEAPMYKNYFGYLGTKYLDTKYLLINIANLLLAILNYFLCSLLINVFVSLVSIISVQKISQRLIFSTEDFPKQEFLLTWNMNLSSFQTRTVSTDFVRASLSDRSHCELEWTAWN